MNLKGDCIEVMKAMKPNSVDAVVTDPPYNLHFMGKDWDKDLLHEKWLTEAYRVLKPGGSMLVMGGTRTSHRLACAIEDTGFIIKDTLMYLYGSGFPKAQSLDGLLEKKYGEQTTKYCLRCLREANLSQTISAKKAKRKTLQSGLSKQGLQGNGKERPKPEIANGEQPRMEGRSYLFQEEGQLSGHQICQSSKMDDPNGKERRIHNDSSVNNGKTPKSPIGQKGSSSSPRPQSKQQRSEESDAFCVKCRAQIIRGLKVGGIKPAYEPIVWAVKPPEGSYVDNVLKWGVGAVNVDECRVGIGDNLQGGQYSGKERKDGSCYGKHKNLEPEQYNHPKGRFPANVILSHHPECVQMGMKKVKGIKGGCTEFGGMFGNKGKVTSSQKDHADKDGYEQVESWDCHPDCAMRLLDEQSGELQSGANPTRRASAKTKNCFGEFEGQKECIAYRGQDNGGASRFFYCAKASRGERNAGLEGVEEKSQRYQDGRGNSHECFEMEGCGRKTRTVNKNNHPTVKPIKLFEYLIKLVTREGQIVLDPFIGSGTTAIAAHNIGRKCVGIEREGEYIEIAKRRISYWQNQPKQTSLYLGENHGRRKTKENNQGRGRKLGTGQHAPPDQQRTFPNLCPEGS